MTTAPRGRGIQVSVGGREVREGGGGGGGVEREGREGGGGGGVEREGEGGE